MTKGERVLVPAESLDVAVERLLTEAAAEGKRWSLIPGRVRTTVPSKPAIEDMLSDRLRRALEHEVVALNPSVGGGDISQRDVNEEVVKKALVALRLSTLKSLANERGVAVAGKAEEIAERIGRAYQWDPNEVARLILEHEEEPSPDRGHVTRLFPLAGTPDIERVYARLRQTAGHYIRIGVARWFVFNRVLNESADSVRVEGSHRWYRATVDDYAGLPRLTPVPSEDTASAWIRRTDSLIQIDGASSGAAKACAAAIQTGGDLQGRGYVPLAGMVNDDLEAHSAFMVDLLVNRFRMAGFEEMDLTVTKFKVGEEVGWDDEGQAENRPALRSVRFEGRHLLDSKVACELLTVGRPLVDMSLSVRVRSDDKHRVARFPIRVAIENNHVLVATGYGSGDPELSLKAHRAALGAVKQEVETGVADSARLEAYAGRIVERAGAESDAAVATMLLLEEEADEGSQPIPVLVPDFIVAEANEAEGLAVPMQKPEFDLAGDAFDELSSRELEAVTALLRVGKVKGAAAMFGVQVAGYRMILRSVMRKLEQREEGNVEIEALLTDLRRFDLQ